MRTRRAAVVVGLATMLAGCGLGDVVNSSSEGSDGAAMTTVEPTFPSTSESESESSTSASQTSSESSETTTTTASPTTTDRSTDAQKDADFSDLTERDSLFYSGNGNSSHAGTRFTSPTGNIQCHITGEGAGCVVEEHPPWPKENRYNDGIPETTPDVIGWYPGSIGDGAPQHWKQQGSWPSRGTGAELPYGTYLDVVTDIDGATPNVRCASRETGMTCVAGNHGFSISRETYDVW